MTTSQGSFFLWEEDSRFFGKNIFRPKNTSVFPLKSFIDFIFSQIHTSNLKQNPSQKADNHIQGLQFHVEVSLLEFMALADVITRPPHLEKKKK